MNLQALEKTYTTKLKHYLLKKEFGMSVSGLSVSLHLRKRGLSYQKPCYRDVARDEQEVEHFVNDTFPRIHRLADKMGADIGFEDEAGNSFTSADSIYDRLSWLYAFFRERLFRDDSESIVAALWSESPPAAGTRVLEVGCGPGYYALRLAARFRHSHVIGIDLSQRLIARARGLAKERSLENCQFYCGDAQQLDMPDASVDVAVLCRLLLIVPQRRRTVAEVHRVLRPGGTCFIAEPRPGVHAWLPLRLMRGVAGFCRLCDRSAQWPSCPCGCARPLNWRAFREITDSQPWGRARFWLDMDYQYAVCRKTEQTPGAL
jgi:arsenite methyltransferase